MREEYQALLFHVRGEYQTLFHVREEYQTLFHTERRVPDPSFPRERRVPDPFPCERRVPDPFPRERRVPDLLFHVREEYQTLFHVREEYQTLFHTERRVPDLLFHVREEYQTLFHVREEYQTLFHTERRVPDPIPHESQLCVVIHHPPTWLNLQASMHMHLCTPVLVVIKKVMGICACFPIQNALQSVRMRKFSQVLSLFCDSQPENWCMYRHADDDAYSANWILRQAKLHDVSTEVQVGSLNVWRSAYSIKRLAQTPVQKFSGWLTHMHTNFSDDCQIFIPLYNLKISACMVLKCKGMSFAGGDESAPQGMLAKCSSLGRVLPKIYLCTGTTSQSTSSYCTNFKMPLSDCTALD